MIEQEETMIMDKYEAIASLNDIYEEMGRLIYQADELIRREFPYEYENARSYWLAQLMSARGGYGYHTYATTMLSCLEGLEESLREDKSEEA